MTRQYLADGSMVEVVGETNGKILVRKYIRWQDRDGDWNEELQQRIRVVDKVYPTAPVTKYSAKVEEYKQQIAELQSRLHGLKGEIQQSNQERQRLLDKLKQVPALQRIENFIDGQITHFVLVEGYAVSIIAKSEATCESRSYPREYRLLTLMGKTSGDLQWNINKYADGSSRSDTECIPCLSAAEARQVVEELFRGWYAKPDDYSNNIYSINAVIQSHQAVGFPIPAWLLEFQRQLKVGELEKKVRDSEAAIASWKKQIQMAADAASGKAVETDGK